MARLLKVSLTGDQARLGNVPAADVARLLTGIESAVARAAGELINKPVRPTGRWGQLIASVAHLRLVGIQSGSVVAVLELPDVDTPEDSLDIDVAGLGEMAVERVMETISNSKSQHAEVARVLAATARALAIGNRYESIVLEHKPRGRGRRQTARLDRQCAARLRVQMAAHVPSAVSGLLYEADFEANSARLRTARGDRVSVSFPEELAPQIHEALRAEAHLVGEVSFDPASASAHSIRVREITSSEQLALALEPGDFWTELTVGSLASAAQVSPLTDISRVQDPDGGDGDDVDDFLRAIEA